MNTSVKTPIETDAVIVGAGPVGLFQVFELGLLEIKAHVIDSLAAVGGQCVELYPDKPIYDIPAVPVCTGQELTDNLLKQIEPFEPTFHLGQEVTLVQKRDDGRFDLETSIGTRFITKTIFIAAGVGSFQPRTIKVDGIEAFEGMFGNIGAQFRSKAITKCVFVQDEYPACFADRLQHRLGVPRLQTSQIEQICADLRMLIQILERPVYSQSVSDDGNLIATAQQSCFANFSGIVIIENRF